MNFLIILINCGFIIFISTYLFKQTLSLQKIFWPALVFKLTAGIVLGLVYAYYYTIGDTFAFFIDAKQMAAFARIDLKNYLNFLWSSSDAYPFWSHLIFKEPRALFFSKIVSVLCLLTLDNYWLVSLYFSLLSFVCSLKLVNTIVRYFETTRVAAVISFLFIPSVVFWGSGIIKECLAVASIFYLSHIFLTLWFKDRVKLYEWLLLLVSVWILWQVKYYYATVFVSVAVTSLVMKFILLPIFKPKYAFFKVLIWLVVYSVPLFLFSFTTENFQPHLFFNVVIKNYNIYLQYSREGAVMHFDNLEPTFWSFLFHSPWALISGLFRPFIWETQNVLPLLMSLENMLLLVVMISATTMWRKWYASKHRLLVFSILVYAFLLCIFLTLSTPNFGTLSRYRISFIPYVFFIVMIDNPIVNYLGEIVQRSFSRLVR